MSHQKSTLGGFIIKNQASFPYSSEELSSLLNALRLAVKVVSHEVNKAGLVGVFGDFGDVNVQGEEQQKLDVFANNTFIQSLKNRDIVCGIVSEENNEFITIEGADKQSNGKYVVLMAEGKAISINGRRILDILPNRIHQRVSIMIKKLESFL